MLAARIKARIHRKEQIGEEKEKVAVWQPIFSIGKLNVLKCGRQRVDLADSTRCDCDVDERREAFSSRKSWGTENEKEAHLMLSFLSSRCFLFCAIFCTFVTCIPC